VNRLGDEVLCLCGEAKADLVLAAPFIKAATLSRLFEEVKSEVSILCCSRWIPEEIAAGLTDIEVWDVVKSRPSAKLYLRSNLHAKYYRADKRCLVGSANITAAALGWRLESNFELLTSLDSSAFLDFERDMLQDAVLVDDTLYDSVRELVLQFKKSRTRDDYVLTSDGRWVPTLRNPEELFLFYSGEGERLSSASRIAAADDLGCFAIAPGLSRDTFEKYVALEFIQKPIIASVDSLLSTPQRFGAVTSLIRRRLPTVDADAAWQTIMRWMRYFLPKRYALSIPSHSEVVFRLEGISKRSSETKDVCDLLRSLNTDKSKEWAAVSKYQAPHKPLMVLSVLELLNRGRLNSLAVEPSVELEALFNQLASIVYPDVQLGHMSLPFFHLENDGFWRLVPKMPGLEIPERSRATTVNLRTYVSHAEIRHDFYVALLQAEKRREAAGVVLDCYFAEETSRLLRASLSVRTLFDEA